MKSQSQANKPPSPAPPLIRLPGISLCLRGLTRRALASSEALWRNRKGWKGEQLLTRISKLCNQQISAQQGQS